MSLPGSGFSRRVLAGLAVTILGGVTLFAAARIESKSDFLDLAARWQSIFESRELRSLQDLVDDYDLQRLDLLRITPGTFTFRVPPGLTPLPFDPAAFPKEFVAGLVPEESHGVAVYPVIACEDVISRERVFLNAYGETLARLPAPKDYDPKALAFELYPYLATAAAADEWAQMLIGWHDPARVVIQYELLPVADLPMFIANVLAERFSTKGRSSATRMAYTGPAVTNLTLTAIESLSSGMRLTVAYPDSYSNRLDFFSIPNLLGIWWSLAGTSAVSTVTNWVEWTDTTATNAQVRFYRVGDGVQDTDGDAFTDARELLLYNSDPEDEDSFPVTVAGSVTHSSTPQTGPIYVVAVTASNSWNTGRSTSLASPGNYTITGVPNLQDYWVRAWRDWCPNGQPDLWEATGTATNCPIYLTNGVSNVVVVLTDPPASISGALSYTGRQDGVIRAVAVTSSGSWSTADADALTVPGAYHIPDLAQTNYWVKAWVDADADGAFDADREASGTWPANPVFLSNSVWAVDFALTDVDLDGDDMPDWWEFRHFGSTNQTAADDFDNDQMPNGWEYTWDLCPTNAADAMDDQDSDGYFNVYEYKHDSNPWKAPGGITGGAEDAIPSATFTLTPGGATKIQTALNSATTPYDIVLLSAGTYTGTNNVNLRFPANPVLLIGEDGAAATILNCGGTTRGVTFDRAQTNHAALARVTIRNGSAANGGGILFASNTAATVYQCIVTNCVATNSTDGGAVYCNKASPTIRDCLLTGNRATDDGGAIRFNHDDTAALVLDCTMTGNAATNKGGAIFSDDNSDGIRIVGTTFAHNRAGSNGGAVSVERGDFTITGCTFSTNTAANDGGAVHLNNDCNVTLTGCVVQGNSAGADGGGIRCKDESDARLVDCTIAGNVAQDNGGGLFCNETSAPVVTNCLFSGNWAWDHGGGAYSSSSQPTLSSCTFTRNTAVDGGGLGCLSSTVSIVACSIVDNWAHADGAGFRAKESVATLRNCLIARNRSFGYGGGVNVKGATGRVAVENCTIANNRTRLAGGGLAATEGGAATNVNTILWGNMPDQISGTITSRYGCIQGGATGTGILTNAPDMTPVLCRLLTNSPCINSGTNAAWMTSGSDIELDPRISSTVVDIGADEFVDTDADGLSDTWERRYFDDLYGTDETADGDDDGLSDADEFGWDTDPGDADTDGDGATDGTEVSAASSPTTAATPNTLTLSVSTGDLSDKPAEKYKITFSNSAEVIEYTGLYFNNMSSSNLVFQKGTSYTIRVEHVATSPVTNATDCWPDPDYDYVAHVESKPNSTNGTHAAWIYGAGHAIHDPDKILGTHDGEDCTPEFAATNGSGQATLYVLMPQFRTYPSTTPGPDKPHNLNLATRQNEAAFYAPYAKCVSHVWSSTPLDMTQYLTGYDDPDTLTMLHNCLSWRVNGVWQTSYELALGATPSADEVTRFNVGVATKMGGDVQDFLIITIVPASTPSAFAAWHTAEAADMGWLTELPAVYSNLTFGTSGNPVDPEPGACDEWNGPDAIDTRYHPDGYFQMRSHITAGGHGHQVVYRAQSSGGTVINTGISAGSADREAPCPEQWNPLPHVNADVRPFVWAAQLDGNPVQENWTTMTAPVLHEGAHVGAYFEVRPAVANALPALAPGTCP